MAFETLRIKTLGRARLAVDAAAIVLVMAGAFRLFSVLKYRQDAIGAAYRTAADTVPTALGTPALAYIAGGLVLYAAANALLR